MGKSERGLHLCGYEIHYQGQQEAQLEQSAH